MQLSEMSAIQRKALTKKVFQAELVVREKVNCHLSLQYNAIKEIVKVPFYNLEQIWSTAEFIWESYEIQRVICGNLCVPHVDVAFTVFSKNGNLKCTCQQYGKTDEFYPHVVAVAEKDGLLENLFQVTSKQEEISTKYWIIHQKIQVINRGKKNQEVVETTSVRVPLLLYKVNPTKQLLILKLTFQRENCLQNIIKTMKNLRFSFGTIQNVIRHGHAFYAN